VTYCYGLITVAVRSSYDLSGTAVPSKVVM
jgi:hypothetical protein